MEWDAVEMAEEDNAVLQYEVYYKEISENATSVDIYDGNENLNVTKGVTTAVVDGLNTGKRHHFFVIARNQGFVRSDQTFSSPFLPAAKPRRSMDHNCPPYKILEIVAIRGQKSMVTCVIKVTESNFEVRCAL